MYESPKRQIHKEINLGKSERCRLYAKVAYNANNRIMKSAVTRYDLVTAFIKFQEKLAFGKQ